MDSKTRRAIIAAISLLFFLLVFFACASTRPGPVDSATAAKVSGLISGLPVNTADEENEISAGILSLGPDGIKSICEMLVPPGTGDDTNARFALSSLTHHVHRPGAEPERKMYSLAMIEALESAADNEVKAFLIRQLQLAGRNEAVPHLAMFLTDERLCEPAAQALTAIHTFSAEAEFIKALSTVNDKNRITIIKSLGDLRSKAAAFEILKYAASDNPELRTAVMYALANIGPYSTDAVLAETLHSGSNYERAQSTSFYLTYAGRLAEAGMSNQAAEICRNLIKTSTATGNKNVHIAALQTLVKAVGESALWDILTAVDSPNKDVRVAALDFTNEIPGKNTTIELFNKMKTVDTEKQSEIQAVLIKRDRKYSTPELEKAQLTWPDSEGFVSLFNGNDLTGWKGLVENPLKRAEMSPDELAEARIKADEVMREHWKVENGVLIFDGEPNGSHICTVRDYGDFEMLVDWKIEPGGDSGIYLRGTPQVQIWDTAEWPEGSGGLYNNQKNPRQPLEVADKPVGEWNRIRIRMTGDRVTVYLNNILVVDNVIMENYWDRNQPIFPTGQIELQSHGTPLHFRNIRIKELGGAEVPAQETEPGLEEGFVSLFNGKDLTGWVGDKTGYVAEDGKIVVHPERGGGSGNLYTEKEYSDFNLRFEFRLTPGANNGLGIRAPLEGDAAYVGMELQILDNTADIYKNLKPYQYHGSIYGIVPAKRGYLNSVGAWNSEEVIVKGRRVTVILNDIVIVDANIDDASTPATLDGRDHPGLKREKGHIGFLGHGSRVEFRNIRIKEIRN